MSDCILVLNAGSSSIKFAVFQGGVATIRGQISDITTAAEFSASSLKEESLNSGGFEENITDHASALAGLLSWLEGRADLPPIDGVGHRVVHGGTDFSEPVVVTGGTLERLERLVPLAPHHQPHNLGAIRAVSDVWPHVPQVACFDTAFHANQPDVAAETGLPTEYTKAGIRRYGFHGLSYEYITQVFAEKTGMPLPDRLVVAHLGNGASMSAIQGGKSIAATMGFSTVDGIAMGTRSGAVDPGALIEVMRRDGLDADGLEDLIYNRSGVLGLSGGLSSDMRTLLASGEPEATRAVDFYCYRICRELGSLAAALGGLDALVFTGGVGANAAPIRKQVCGGVAWLGITLDETANEQGNVRITEEDSDTHAYAFDTDEESVIAGHTARILND